MTSSTSSSRNYIRFLTWAGVTFAGLWSVLVLFLLVVDPLDNVPFSPSFDRAPIAFNQRFSYPAVARKPAFDSVIIGNSTSRPLDPQFFNETLDARFANLSMNAATPYEQQEMAALFFRHHPQAKYLILALDLRHDVWCDPDDSPRTTTRDFPAWMYDENPWNDLAYLVNGLNLEIAGKQAGYLLGWRKPTYQPSGYGDLTKGKPYDAAEAIRHIYLQPTPQPFPEAFTAAQLSDAQSKALVFASLNYLKPLLDSAPTTTKKIVYFVPQHGFTQPPANSAKALAIRECKARIRAQLAHYPNLQLFDYYKRTSFTADDRNYLDAVHLSREGAARFARTLLNDISTRK